MMPLNFADSGEDVIIKKIGGNAKVKAHLNDLGFVVGSKVSVISSMSGNLIVNIKETRVAISQEMASKIMV
ncbi:MAG: ferrous iron transport protein A [Clostridiales bacterium]|nr:ferrous iron transport protein A [Clostridiales bacterium]